MAVLTFLQRLLVSVYASVHLTEASDYRKHQYLTFDASASEAMNSLKMSSFFFPFAVPNSFERDNFHARDVVGYEMGQS